MSLRQILATATIATALTTNATAQRIQDLPQEEKDLQTGKASLTIYADMSMGKDASVRMAAQITRVGPDYKMEVGVEGQPTTYVAQSPCTVESLNVQTKKAADRLKSFPKNPQFEIPKDLSLFVDFTTAQLEMRMIPLISRVCGIPLSKLTPSK